MLKKIILKSFKSFKSETELSLAPLTVMVGANASGKSNAVEGLRFLSWLAQGQKLSSIQYVVNESDKIVRGRIDNLPYDNGSSFEVGCVTDDPDWNHLKIKIVLRDEELHIANEELTGPAAPPSLYHIVETSDSGGSDVQVAYNNFALPSNLAPRTMIAPMWDDLNFTQASKAYIMNETHKTVIAYHDVYRVTGEGPFTFEAILYDNGNIVLQYLHLENPPADYTVGIQNDMADDGLTIVYNQPYLKDSLAVMISKHSWVTVSPMAVSVSRYTFISTCPAVATS